VALPVFELKLLICAASGEMPHNAISIRVTGNKFDLLNMISSYEI